MTIEVRQAESHNMWGLQLMLDRMQADNAKRAAAGIPLTLEVQSRTVVAFFNSAVTHPGGMVFFPLLFIDGKLCGFAVIQELQQAKIVDEMVTLSPYSFVWALYKDRTVRGGRGNSEMKAAVVGWARSRGHSAIMGNCVPHFRTRAAERFGFKVMHIVVGMEIPDAG